MWKLYTAQIFVGMIDTSKYFQIFRIIPMKFCAEVDTSDFQSFLWNVQHFCSIFSRPMCRKEPNFLVSYVIKDLLLNTNFGNR